MKTFTILLFTLFINSCGASKDAKTSINPDMTDNTLNGEFTINTLDTQASIQQKLTLKFDDATKQVSGFAGCNRFFGTYTVDGNKLTFSNIGATKMLCPENNNTIETDYFKVLESVTNFNLSDNSISLLNNKKEVLNATKNSSSKLSQNQDNNLSFTYTAFTRGTYTMIKIDQSSIKTQFNRTDKEKTKTISTEDWTTLKTLINAIDVKSLNTLEPPSTAHQYDGAAGATLTVTLNNEAYTTPTFDGGNPAKKIAELVNKILAMGNVNAKE